MLTHLVPDSVIKAVKPVAACDLTPDDTSVVCETRLAHRQPVAMLPRQIRSRLDVQTRSCRLNTRTRAPTFSKNRECWIDDLPTRYRRDVKERQGIWLGNESHSDPAQPVADSGVFHKGRMHA